MRTLTVCGRSIADFTIVLPENPHPAEKTAADFLKDTIKKACGIELPVSHKAEHGIFIGQGTTEGVKWDGFCIFSDQDHLYLSGLIPRGTLYAAYSFAEKYLGYRYFAPDCIVIPTEGEAELPKNTQIVDNPAFLARRTTFDLHLHNIEYGAHARLNDCMPLDDNYGGTVGLPSACHSFGKYCSGKVYFKDHPEYFSLAVNEETGEKERIPCEPGYGPGQLCLTNPDVLRVVTENILKELRENPDTKIVEFSQADNPDTACICENCAAVDAEEESQAGSLIRFVNALGEAIEKEFPDVLIRTFAYQYTSKPPKHTKARHNVLIRYCTMDACFRHSLSDPNCKVNSGRFYKEMEEWKNKCCQMSIWDYLCNWRSFLLPYPNLISLRENARYFADCGAIHVLEEVNSQNTAGGAYSHLICYLSGILLWNPYISEEEYYGHIKEFLMAFYGKAWREIAECMRIEYEETADRCILCMDQNIDDSRRFYREYMPYPYQTIKPNNALTKLAARHKELIEILDRADALAETEAERFRIDAMRLSFNYMEHSCVAHEKDKMTAEEQAAHEAQLEKILADKIKHGFFWNLSTSANENGAY